jgi:putative transposase
VKKSTFPEAQIAFALKQAETGTQVDEICRKQGISQATFFNWKKKYGGLGTNEMRKLRQLEEENRQLKQLVADLSLDKQMLQDVLKKSCETGRSKAIGSMDDRQLPGFGTQSLWVRDAVHFDVLLLP